MFNLLEGRFELLVVNAQHSKAVPGRKTDIKDAEWIADLLQHGQVRASFIPAGPQRALRDLTRYRVRLTEEKAREVNRVRDVPGSYESEAGRCRQRSYGESLTPDLAGDCGRRNRPEPLSRPGRRPGPCSSRASRSGLERADHRSSSVSAELRI